MFCRANEKAFGQKFLCYLDDNTDMIVAFASYCREVSDQEQPSWRSHTPYGLIRRPLDGELPTFEVIGQMYRPEWEDRWDAVERGYLMPFEDNPPQGKREATSEPAKSKFVQRLLLIIIVWTAVLVLRRLLK